MLLVMTALDLQMKIVAWLETCRSAFLQIVEQLTVLDLQMIIDCLQIWIFHRRLAALDL